MIRNRAPKGSDRLSLAERHPLIRPVFRQMQIRSRMGRTS